VASRLSDERLAKRRAGYEDEVRRLLDAGLAEMRRCGTTARPRVADIVQAAGLSNDAFYRHFKSKDALVAAILDDGAQRLQGYLAHRMEKAPDAEGEVRAWVDGVLSQADEEIAATTLAVLWNGGPSVEGGATGRRLASGALAPLLVEPLTALGSPTPELDAAIAAHAAVGRLVDLLLAGTPATPADVERVTTFCLAAATTDGHG
jgi:AcrR family transcriptional regulator